MMCGRDFSSPKATLQKILMRAEEKNDGYYLFEYVEGQTIL